MTHKCFRLLMFVTVLPAALLAQDDAASQRAVARGRAHLDQIRATLGVDGPDHELRVRKANFRADRSEHVRFGQYFKGIPVFEGEAITHSDDAGNTSVTNSLRTNLSVGTVPSIPEGAARAAVMRLLGLRGAADLSAELKILPRGERSLTDRLVWHVKAFSEDDQTGPVQFDVFLDAQNGQVAWMFNSLETASVTGTGRTMYIGQVPLPLDLSSGTYLMRNPLQANLATADMNNRQNGSATIFGNTTGVFGNFQRDLTDRSTAGTDAHFGMTKTWEYYQTTFGRNGINGAGRSSYGRVHYGRNYENAFWSSSCFCMTYGDGATTFLPLVSLDVTGHEMSHGVMASEANLTYSGESGGLNEANSDIFGTLVEYYVNSTTDVPDYWIGERIFKSNWSGGTYVQNRALRYMDDPSKDGRSPACWSSTLGSLDVHYSSGPGNHMFYLLSNGGTSKCNGSPVSGIGRVKAAAIWYKAISDYMTSSTNYKGARTAALNAAAALYGTGSIEYNTVAAAFSAINVN